MGMTDDQVVTGKMYSYINDGDEKMGVLEMITKPIKGYRWCRLDNNDQMTLDAFKEVAKAIDEGDYDYSAQQPKQSQQNESLGQNSQNGANQMMNVQTDSDGNPVLKASTPADVAAESEEALPVMSPQQFQAEQKKNDPVLALLKKANSEEIILSIELPVQLVDKKLFGIVVESFGGESKDTVYSVAMESVSPEQLKEAVIKQIEKHYNGQTES